MSLIDINDLTFSYDTNYENIFEHASLQIDTDWRLGFIGRNGRGKTTLLKLLLGEYDYSGSIRASVHFDYFPYEVIDQEALTGDVIKNTIAPFKEWEEEMERCLEHQETEQGKEASRTLHMERYGKLQELYQANDGYIIEELIEKELGKLQVDLSVLARPFFTLSFGEKTKILLAALFLKKNNFLLIDEPTNHLDMEGREILAGYLKTKKGFILVSHDRAFLDRCIDHVLSINRADIEVQKGNYSSWQKNKEQQDNYELGKNEKLKKDILSLSESAKRTAGWSEQVEASKIGMHAPDRGFIGHKAAKMMKRAKAVENRKLDAIEEKKGLLKNIEQSEPLKINLLPFPNKRLIEAEDLNLYYRNEDHVPVITMHGAKAAPFIGSEDATSDNLYYRNEDHVPVITMHGAKAAPFIGSEDATSDDFYYRNREIASGINFTLCAGDRICIRGRNGSGKSTLFKLLLGEDIVYTGRLHIAKGLKLSYVSQDTSGLSGNLKDFASGHGLDETIFKTVLRQLDFSRNQFEKDICEFSGGQKKKVLLAKSLSEPAHVFLWDEPLNFVDVFSRLQIEELILKFRPTMIFVEHDRVFAEKIATKTIRLDAE